MESTTNDPYLNAVMVLTGQRNFPTFSNLLVSTAYVWTMEYDAVACAKPVASAPINIIEIFAENDMSQHNCL